MKKVEMRRMTYEEYVSCIESAKEPEITHVEVNWGNSRGQGMVSL